MSYILAKFAYTYLTVEHTFFIVVPVKHYYQRQSSLITEIRLSDYNYVSCRLLTITKISKSAAEAIQSSVHHEEFYQQLFGIDPSTKLVPGTLSLLDKLPNDLLQLVLLELTDKDIQSLSQTNQALRNSLRQLYNVSWFWKERYARLAAGGYYTIDKVHPDYVQYYGWRKLYFRLSKFVVPQDRDYYVGPIGFVWIGQGVHLNYTIFPIRGHVWMSKEAKQSTLVYFSFVNSLEYNRGTMNDNKFVWQGLFFVC